MSATSAGVLCSLRTLMKLRRRYGFAPAVLFFFLGRRRVGGGICSRLSLACGGAAAARVGAVRGARGSQLALVCNAREPARPAGRSCGLLVELTQAGRVHQWLVALPPRPRHCIPLTRASARPHVDQPRLDFPAQVATAQASVSLYSTDSRSASQLASMMLSLTPTVPQMRWPSPLSINTRVRDPAPELLSRMRTL